MTDRRPVAEEALLKDATATPWARARARLANPVPEVPWWLATVDKDGRPHLMPFIGIWIDDAIYFVSSEETQKGRNLIGDPRCVISTSNTEAPSMDLIVEAEARKVEDAARLKEVVGVFTSKLKWPLEIQDGAVIGPNAPTAGPPPYAVFEAKPIVVFGLPGMAGMEQTDPDDRFTPTRWQF